MSSLLRFLAVFITSIVSSHGQREAVRKTSDYLRSTARAHVFYRFRLREPPLTFLVDEAPSSGVRLTSLAID